jgi:spermidine/putrescine transport system substrate-binding protein
MSVESHDAKRLQYRGTETTEKEPGSFLAAWEWFSRIVFSIFSVSSVSPCAPCRERSLYVLSLSLFLFAAPAYAEDVLYLYNWNSYLSDETIERFESSCRCRLKQDYYSDNEEMLAKLDAGAIGYDVIVPTGNAVEALIRRQALRPLDKSLLPHLSNIKREFLDTWYDPGNRYSVPYASTVTLLGFNATRLAELGLPTDSWALIFDPEYLKKLKGRVTVLNSQRELMAAAMRYLGHSVQTRDPAQWDAAKRLILRAKPYWATFSNSTYIKDLAIGTIWVAHGYSSDMYRAQQDALEAGRPFAIGFSTPKEGAVLAVDNFVVHRSGRRADLAYRFIDFMLDGANAADISNLIGAGNPNAAATPYIRPEIAGNPAIFPTPQQMRSLEMLRDFDPETRRVLSRMWTEIKVR